MQRDSRAYLTDILDAIAAIQAAVSTLREENYGESRLIRSLSMTPSYLPPSRRDGKSSTSAIC